MNNQDFNYLLLLGSSGVGKTTYAKTVATELKAQGVKVYACDPNRQWLDLLDQEVSGVELTDFINRVAKPVLFKGYKGLLIVEDIGLTISQIMSSLNVPRSYALHSLKLIMENARKYGFKVMVIGHRLQSEEIDGTLFQQFDTVITFNFPITPHASKLLKLRGIGASDVSSLPRFTYILANHTAVEKGMVQPLPSHVAIEQDREFQVKYLLKKCTTNSERIAVLSGHLHLNNQEIARILRMPEKTVRVYKALVRRRFRRDLALAPLQEVKWLPDERRVHAEAYQSILF